MKRREFIGIAATGAAAFALPAVMLGRDISPAAAALARPRLLDILRNEKAVGAIGRRYRADVPAENDARVLEQVILADTNAADPRVATARIDARVAEDFSAGRTVTVDGWILSLTEARQCALYSLQNA